MQCFFVASGYARFQYFAALRAGSYRIAVRAPMVLRTDGAAHSSRRYYPSRGRQSLPLASAATAAVLDAKTYRGLAMRRAAEGRTLAPRGLARAA